MSEVLVERNELEAAEAHLARGAELGRGSGRLNAVTNSAPALVRLRQTRGDAEGALAAIADAESALGEPRAYLARAELLALKARALVRQGRLSDAAECVSQATSLAGGDRGLTGEIVALAATRVLVARSKPDDAVAHLTRALAAAEASGRLGTALELRILRGLEHLRRGDIREAEADVDRAIAFAEPEGYIRIFVDEGEPMADLLRRLATRPARAGESGSHSAAYLATLLAAFGPADVSRSPTSSPQPDAALSRSASGVASRGKRPGRQPSALIEPLSERELQVLRLMAEGLTNERIAARLIIALGTVKAHVHNISGKLGAQNRAHAVARARELEIL